MIPEEADLQLSFIKSNQTTAAGSVHIVTVLKDIASILLTVYFSHPNLNHLQEKSPQRDVDLKHVLHDIYPWPRSH